MKIARETTRLLLAAATAITLGVAVAEANEPLPGVEPGKSIVQPLPEPLDSDVPVSDMRSVKVGDWDVRVSGSLTVDIGASAVKPPRR